MSVSVKQDGTPSHTDTPDGVYSLEDLRQWHTDHGQSAFDSATLTPQLGDRPAKSVKAGNGEQSR
jgi:hypothetical protein